MGFLESFRRPRKPEKPVELPVDTPSSWKLPVAELTERVDFLEQALNRLRGRVTGGQKRTAADPVEAESSEVDRNPTIAPEGGLDRWQQLKQVRGRHRGVLQG